MQDTSSEPESVRKLYGCDQENTKSFAEQCLMARRFSEAGVRFVQVTHRYWDSHGNLRKEHARLAGEMEKPVAGLITYLKQWGLLYVTLVLWGGEFGRTPVAQGGDGRDHNPHANTMPRRGRGQTGYPVWSHGRIRILRGRTGFISTTCTPPSSTSWIDHGAHLSLRGPGLPSDGCPWTRGAGRPRVSFREGRFQKRTVPSMVRMTAKKRLRARPVRIMVRWRI